MRQRLIIIVTLVAVVLVLVLLNAASYVKVEPTADSEAAPDRSTFNAGATGTRALYDFLHESGYQVARWRDSTASLLSHTGPKPSTVVVIGDTKIPFSKTETKEMLQWVESGGRLVLIDRSPDRNLLPDSGEWAINTHMISFPWHDLDPTDFGAMTNGVKPLTPTQATLLARDVEKVMPSRFAGAITIAPREKKNEQSGHSKASSEDEDEDSAGELPPRPEDSTADNSPRLSPAPVTNF